MITEKKSRGKDGLYPADRILDPAYAGLHLADGSRIARRKVVQTEGEKIHLVPQLRQAPSVNLISHTSSLYSRLPPRPGVPYPRPSP